MKIFAADFVLPISSEPFENGAVLIENGKILAVGKFPELKENFPGAEIENFGEAVIMPGFVNAHSHLEITAMRGFLDDVEDDFRAWLLKLNKARAEVLGDNDIETAAILGVIEGARAGVTCFGDIGRMGRAGFNALKKIGLRGVLFQETEFSPDDKTADDDFEKLKAKFLELKETENELVKIGLSPHSPYTVSAKLFRKIAEFAKKESIKTSIHVAESLQEQELLLNGTGFFAGVYKNYGFEWTSPNCSSVEYLDKLGVLETQPLLAHCVNVSDSDIAKIAETGTKIAHCPKSNAKFGHGIAPLEMFLDKQIAVGFGSDSVASNNSCDILEEARFAALLARTRGDKKRFLSAKEIIETATFGGAKSLGLENEIGTLEKGKQADFIILSLKNPAQMPVSDIYSAVLFSSGGRDMILTVVGGREIYRENFIKTIDEDSIKAEVKTIGAKLKEAF